MLDSINYGPTEFAPHFLFVAAAVRHAWDHTFSTNYTPAVVSTSKECVDRTHTLMPLPALASSLWRTIEKELDLRIEDQRVFGYYDAEGGRHRQFVLCSRSAAIVVYCQVTNNNQAGSVMCHVWQQDIGRAQDLCKALRDSFPEVEVPASELDLVPFTVWRKNSSGNVDYSTRDIKCPDIESLRSNYPAWNKLDHLCKLVRPDARGRMVIWTGPPGTGKTTAVRALARNWFERQLTSIELVLDPERLFADADYMHQLLIAQDHAYSARQTAHLRYKRRISTHGGYLSEPSESSGTSSDVLRLIVIEDGAQFFAANCRERAGFARLLNMADGIIGQGIRMVFLLTANEQIDSLDPAVVRPGRCIQWIDFPTFNYEEASRWCQEKGILPPEDLADCQTLAQLYAHLNNYELNHEQRGAFGFITASRE